MKQTQFKQLLSQEIQQMCEIALIEDLAGKNNTDITAELIPAEKNAHAELITRESGILCGTAWVEKIFELLGGLIKINWQAKDGDAITANQTICQLNGNARQMLTGERSAMNFLQTLSATATTTAEYVEKIKHTQCQLLDTRKTIPGMRFAQKYAVKCGGGNNHRLGLSDAFLIKENHIITCGGIIEALKTAKNNHPEKLLEIEVENIQQLKQAMQGQAQVIMLDNFNLQAMQQAVELRNQLANPAKLEASGNIDVNNIQQIAETGVDFISVGDLTKNIRALDLSMRVFVDED